MNRTDTIAAPATAPGGALGIIRMSGPEALSIGDRLFRSATRKTLSDAAGHTLLYGEIIDPDTGSAIDDVLVSVFRAPHSYTGENSIEISHHGSRYIQSEILRSAIRCGARSAEAGEFTVRAFLAGKLDLSQAEAVADMIASTDRGSHALALTQMRGGYSRELGKLRDELVTLMSLLELELDFSEEEVEFADRTQLHRIMTRTNDKILGLIHSFTLGNAIKEGVNVAIVGNPNAGKSTLLNTLLNEERAMVSDIAGTTRDTIEETLVIGGIRFRLSDTAGIRRSDDRLERMGIERTFAAVGRARIVILLIDASSFDLQQTLGAITSLDLQEEQHLCLLLNKIDKLTPEAISAIRQTLASATSCDRILAVSAKHNRNIGALTDFLHDCIDAALAYNGETVVSNIRHYEALQRAHEALQRALDSLASRTTADLLAEDIREVLYHLGTITGEITSDEILGEIFSKFCIGK